MSLIPSGRGRRLPLGCAALLLLAGGGCSSDSSDPPPPPDLTSDLGEPFEARAQRLTAEQYRSAIADIFGDAVVVAVNLEPDRPVGGLRAIGSSTTTVSAWGVEQYEQAAFEIATQAIEDEATRARLVTCSPEATVDADCARATLSALGMKLWRRPLTPDELDPIVRIAGDAATELSDFHQGLVYGLAVLLQAPSFLMRAEVGAPDAGGALAYDDYEMAARLSFLLWNTTPDDELLAAAGRGELVTDEGLRVQAQRLLDSDRARTGVRAFFTDLLELYKLDTMSKDTNLFTHMSPQLGPAAREETLRMFERLVFDEDSDIRNFLVTRRTEIDRRLAALYSVPAATREGFAEVEYPEDSARLGYLGQVSFLALHSHPVSTSATLRGKFVREAILCGSVPAPPADVDTALPEPTGTARTLRERVSQHLTDRNCSGCHSLMDNIGLGFEQFDGIGRYRTRDNGDVIDPSGEIDGAMYFDARDMAWQLRDDPRVADCLVRNTLRYATGELESRDQTPLLDVINARFEASGFRFKALLMDVIMSPAFRRAQEAS